MKLYAICWRDPHEPWGWAPATKEHDAPEGTLPDGPFFWDPLDCLQVLTDVQRRDAEERIPLIRQHDRERHDRQMRDYARSLEPRSPRVEVRIVGQPPAEPKAPRELLSERELREAAQARAEQEWSIQTYDVPPPP